MLLYIINYYLEMNRCNNSNYAMPYLVMIAFNSVLLYYVFRHESSECNCPKDWRRDYVKYFTSIMIAYAIVMLFLGYEGLHPVIFVPIYLASILNVYFLYTYVRNVAEDCPCNKNDYVHEFVKLYSLVAIVVVFVMGLVLVSNLINYFACPSAKGRNNNSNRKNKN